MNQTYVTISGWITLCTIIAAVIAEIVFKFGG